MRRLLSILAAVWILLECHSVAATCMAAATAAQNSASINPAGSDGIVHVTYAFVDSSGNAMTPDTNVAAAFAAATQEWNGFTSTTNVAFNPLATQLPVSSANIQIQLTSNTQNNGGCASYNPSTSRLYYGSTFQSAASSLSTGTLILAHELGHSLGLDDAGTNPSPPSIMNNPSNALPGGCTAPQVPTTQVQKSDASTATLCTSRGRVYLQHDGVTSSIINTDPLTFTTGSPACSYTYETVNFYVDGVYSGSEDFIAAAFCQ